MATDIVAAAWTDADWTHALAWGVLGFLVLCLVLLVAAGGQS